MKKQILIMTSIVFALTGFACAPKTEKAPDEKPSAEKVKETVNTPEKAAEKTKEMPKIDFADKHNAVKSVIDSSANVNSGVTLSFKKVKTEIKKSCAEINVIYPVFDMPAIDKAVSEHIDKLYAEASKAAESICDRKQKNQQIDDNSKYLIDIDPTNNDDAAIDFYVTETNALGDESGESQTVHSYVMINPKTGVVLDPLSILPDRVKSLNTISRLSQDKLLAELGQDQKEYIERGTAPTEKNFKNIARTPKGIIILFAKDQVAESKYGEQYVEIGWPELD